MVDQLALMVPNTPAEPPNGKYTYKEFPEIHDGKQLLADYPNNYGASVIQNRYSYGGREGLYEIAVRHLPSDTLCYATPVTNDVIGYLSEDEVVATLHKIAALPPNGSCDHRANWDLDDDESDASKNINNPEFKDFLEKPIGFPYANPWRLPK